ncbi:MAG: FAD-dependent oxidoreductase [Acidobacteriota bacterium]
MKRIRYLITGTGPAGIGAAEEILKRDKNPEIIIFSKEPYLPYSRALLPYLLSSQIKEEEIYYDRKDVYKNPNVSLKLGEKVSSIDFKKNQIIINNNKKISFDYLLIATGGRTLLPEIEGINSSKISSFSTLDDYKTIQHKIKSTKKAVVIGGGLVGVKAAISLKKLGVNVILIELLSNILNTILDKEGSSTLEKFLEKKGIEIRVNSKIERIIFKRDGELSGVTLEGGEKIESDMVINAAGIRPNLEIVEDSEIKTNQGIIVDKHLKTNIENVYAAGDVAEAYDMLRQSYWINPNWTCAFQQGRIAGANMAGANEEYSGSFAMNSLEFYSLPCISMGIVNASSQAMHEVKRVIPARDIYRKIFIKDGKLIGAILIGDLERAGTLNFLLRNQIDVSNVAEDILDDKYNFIALLKELRKKEMLGEVTWPESLSSTEKYKKHIDLEKWTQRVSQEDEK